MCLITCAKKKSDFSNFFQHSVEDKFSIQIPNYLEEQDFEISNSTLEYGNDLIARLDYQQNGTNEKFKSGAEILPIQNTFDINLISGTSPNFNINNIQFLSEDQLKPRENLLLKMLKIKAEAKQKNILIEKLSKLEVKKTDENTYYFTETFKVNKSTLTFIIMPLQSHMLNISFSCEDKNIADFEKSINSIIVNENL